MNLNVGPWSVRDFVRIEQISSLFIDLLGRAGEPGYYEQVIAVPDISNWLAQLWTRYFIIPPTSGDGSDLGR